MISHQTRTLVTGGAGFIGSHLVESLVGRGAAVTVVDNLITGREENLAAVRSRIRFVEAELGAALLSGAIEVGEFDQVYHCAANSYIPPSVENPQFDFDMNVRATFLLLEALRTAARRPRLVNMSSMGVYGNPARLPIRETDPTVPISPYGVSKLTAERYVAVYCRLFGLRATSLRFSSVYGVRQRKQVVFDLIRKVRANPRRIEVIGDGTQTRDLTYVTDIVAASLLVAEAAPGRGEVYNVATGVTHTIAELVAAVCQVCGAQPEVVYTGELRPGDADKWEVDISALSALGYRPQVSLEEGLRRVVAWHDEARMRAEI